VIEGMLNSALVVGSEVVLSLYPILIKTVPVNLDTQIVSRMLTFSIAAALLAPSNAIAKTWGSLQAVARSSGLGAITLAHVATSYYAFKELPAGVAMSLFYTYPILNLLGGALLFGESISGFQLLMMLLAFVGVLLVSFGSAGGLTKSEEGEKKEIHWAGVFSALAAAVTEVAMYFAVRTTTQSNPFTSILELYPGAALLMVLLVGARGGFGGIDISGRNWSSMILFNLLIGFAGYATRFYAIPKVSTFIFSILSYIGVVASFIFGWLFVGEVPSTLSVIGAALISVASGATVEF
jgi:drug/metabolite transporter (DMT)-like permease